MVKCHNQTPCLKIGYPEFPWISWLIIIFPIFSPFTDGHLMIPWDFLVQHVASGALPTRRASPVGGGVRGATTLRPGLRQDTQLAKAAATVTICPHLFLVKKSVVSTCYSNYIFVCVFGNLQVMFGLKRHYIVHIYIYISERDGTCAVALCFSVSGLSCGKKTCEFLPRSIFYKCSCLHHLASLYWMLGLIKIVWPSWTAGDWLK